MRNPLHNKTSLAISLGLVLTAIFGSTGLFNHWLRSQKSTDRDPNQVFSPPTARAGRSLDGSRASLQLASNLIKQNQGKSALSKLHNLEQDYPPLAPYILLKQGQAYKLEQQQSQATKIWQKLVDNYPDSPATAEALYFLGKNNSQYWTDAIASFPNHPRTHQIIRQLLHQNPAQPQLMLVLVKYDPDGQDVDRFRDILVAEYASQLSPPDWEIIADGYWNKWQYPQAGEAYRQAPLTSRNLYRAARGLHLGGNKTIAQQLYQQLIQQFPQTEDTPWALRRLATLVKPQQALKYLDVVIQQFPQQAPEALLEKAKILESLNSPALVAQTRQLLLTQYSQSETAAKYRWQMAQTKAQAEDLVSAWQWAQQIATNNSDSPLAPKASFWIGKWAEQLGRKDDAQTAFESVLLRYPQSYYAWRSAVALGWQVGNFNTIRQLKPQIYPTKALTLPPAGSEIFQELYQLGLTEEAWNQFQVEITNQASLTVAEEFTYGLLELYRGKHLRGINRIGNLTEKTDPQNKQQWQQLQQTSAYWQALFPFPFEDSIFKWSQQRQLNPLLVTALIRQESRFEPEIRSSAGALGLMQVMPETGQSVAQQLGLENYSLTNPEDNINLGTFYLDYTHRRYDNNSLLAVASYNAGPNNVAKWVSRYGLKDLDRFVEKIPFPETQGYVESVFENYWNYLLIYNSEIHQLFQQIS